jgi:hypothetical protein
MDLDFDLIAPSAIKLEFLPRLLNIDFQDMCINFADADRVERKDLPENRDDKTVTERDTGEGGDVDSFKRLALERPYPDKIEPTEST